MLTVDHIFAALDGPTAIARGLDVPVQTAHSWKANGSIPRWRRPAILQLAISKEAELSAEALAYLGARIALPSTPDAAEAA